ncbi:hypothetical protein GGS20DRAFT_259139 [Poronia punctata]|nr:hypothetical protein GGS20DRAFT_259139 [Poronia punctata]
MKIRYRGPSGTGSVGVSDDVTVAELIVALEAQIGLGAISVKFGWPLQTLAAHQANLPIRSLGLQRESLTVVPLEGGAPVAGSKTVAVDAQLAANLSYGSGEDVKVDMPESHTTLVLRVMPDDGDCMFTAVGGALGGIAPLGASATPEWTPAALRRLVVDTIRRNPIKYDANFLGSTPNLYCARLLDGMWGGAIELSILSELFALEIYSIDVKTGKAYQFGEQKNYEQFVVVIYSGVHYDRVAEAATEGAMNLVEFDVTRWETACNERIIHRARDICQILHDRHYYTSVSDFIVLCNECHELLQGEKAITHHARQTGHSGVTEVADTTV